MKRLLLTTAISHFAIASFAQFAPIQYFETSNNGLARKIQSLDANKDGVKDIAVLYQGWPYDFLKFYLQDNNGNFITYQSTQFDSLTSDQFVSGLIDNDAYEDLIVVQGNHYELAWYKNDGNNFIQKSVINDTTANTSQVLIKDIDKDGLNDIISLEHHEIVIYWQGINNNFNIRQVIHSGTEFYSLTLSDMNGDGYDDVLTGSGGFEVLLNNKNRTFNLLSNSWGVSLNFNLASADADSDGDNDVITWETLQGIYIYYNDGTGTTFSRDTIFKNSEQFKSLLFMDMNSDSLLDIVTTIGQMGKIIVFENEGQIEFNTYQQFHQEQGSLLYIVYAEDLNNDGRKDIVWAAQKGGVHLSKTPLFIDMNDQSLKNVNIYPNPSNGKLAIINTNSKHINYLVLDIMGRTVYSGVLKPKSNSEEILLDKQGTYIVKFYDKNLKQFVKKIIIR